MDLRKTIVAKGRRFRETLVSRGAFLCAILLLGFEDVFAAAAADITSGVTAIDNIGREIGSYVAPVRNVIYSIAAVVAIIGCFNIYFKLQNGDQDVTKRIMMVVGGCIALICLASALPSFFGNYGTV